ncbi:hypothetical protein ABTA45_19900, partial [Acinetobacter baumannii]
MPKIERVLRTLVGGIALAFGFFVASVPALAQQKPEPIAVEVSNTSEPVLCAEKDNVTLNFASPEVRKL